MAREESHREDLLREATALVERIELRLGTADNPIGTGSARASCANDGPIVIGFRANGALSIFFGDDPVFQFNAAGELRRAYCGGRLIKAVRGRLVSLQRVRHQTEVQLLSQPLTDGEQSAFIASMQQRLRHLADALENGGYRVVGRVPADADVLGRVQEWLARHDGLPIAVTPRV
jgi:hypothetical protein